MTTINENVSPMRKTQSDSRWMFRGLVYALLLSGCATDQESPTSASPPISGQIQAAQTSQESIDARLPRVAGACIVSSHRQDGRYISRSIHVPLPRGLASQTGNLARFAYAGPLDRDSSWSRLALCTIPDTPGAQQYFASLFRGRLIASQADSAGAQALGSGTLRAAATGVQRSTIKLGLPVYYAESSTKSAPLTFAATPLTACDPNAIIQDPGCTPDNGGGGSGSAGVNYCDPNAILPPPGCIYENEYVEPPVSPQIFGPPSSITGPTISGCAGTADIGAVIGGARPYVVMFRREACTTVMPLIVINIQLEREHCLLWSFFCVWRGWGLQSVFPAANALIHEVRTVENTYMTGYYRTRGIATLSFPSGNVRVSDLASGKMWVPAMY